MLGGGWLWATRGVGEEGKGERVMDVDCQRHQHRYYATRKALQPPPPRPLIRLRRFDKDGSREQAPLEHLVELAAKSSDFN